MTKGELIEKLQNGSLADDATVLVAMMEEEDTRWRVLADYDEGSPAGEPAMLIVGEIISE
jgi:hypothetical protein